MGRKAYAPSEQDRKHVTRMAMMGMTVDDMATVIDVSAPTLRKYFPEEIRIGCLQANSIVAASLFKMATQVDKPVVAAAIFWLKARAGWREEDSAAEQIGAKGRAHQAAQRVTQNRKFAPGSPPKLVVNNDKR